MLPSEGPAMPYVTTRKVNLNVREDLSISQGAIIAAGLYEGQQRTVVSHRGETHTCYIRHELVLLDVDDLIASGKVSVIPG